VENILYFQSMKEIFAFKKKKTKFWSDQCKSGMQIQFLCVYIYSLLKKAELIDKYMDLLTLRVSG